MRKTFKISKLGNVYEATETTGVGLKAEALSPMEFRSWDSAVAYFVGLGASEEALAEAKRNLDSQGHTPLII